MHVITSRVIDMARRVPHFRITSRLASASSSILIDAA